MAEFTSQFPTNCYGNYHLTREQYESLIARAGGQCEICGAPQHDFMGLVIDHDHQLGHRAVRGLVCRSCNGRLWSVERGKREPDASITRYLENPWHKEAGIDAVGCPPNCKWGSHRKAAQQVRDAISSRPGRGHHTSNEE